MHNQMKMICLALILLMAGCTKELDERETAPMSVSYIIDEYDQSWKFIRSFSSYHVCRVPPDELKRFLTMGTAPEQICNETRTIRLVIKPDKEYHRGK